MDLKTLIRHFVLELITTNSGEDTRLNMLQKTGDGNSFLANDGLYKAITIPVNLSDLNNDIGFIANIPDDYVTDEEQTKDLSYTVNRGQSLLYNVYKTWRELSLLEKSKSFSIIKVCLFN